MVIQKRETRTRVVQAAASALFDFAIAAVIAWAFRMESIAVVFIFLGLQALYLALWVRHTAFAWLWWFAAGKKQLVAHILDVLRSGHFPNPGPYITSADTYLSEVANNEAVPISTRLAAQSDAACFQLLGSMGQVQVSIRLNIAYERALEEYRRSLELLRPGETPAPAASVPSEDS